MSNHFLIRSNFASIPVRFAIILAGSLLGCMGSGFNVATAQQNDWPQFRGPRGDAIVNVDLPAELDTDANLAWKTEVNGVGWSSPVVVDSQVWFTSARVIEASDAEIQKQLAGDPLAAIKTLASSVDLYAVCVDARDGSLVHEIPLTTVKNPEPINPMNSYASPTPAISGDFVICHFGSYGTWCLNRQTADEVWSTKLVVNHSVGPGSSPIIVGDKVLLVCDGTDVQYVAAVSLMDGSMEWKTSRPPIRATNGEYQKAYSTPLITDWEGQQIAIIPGAQWCVAYDVENGEELWRADCGNGFSTTPMAVRFDDSIVMSTGYMRPSLVAIRLGGQGDVTQSHVLWQASSGAPTMPSMLGREDQVVSLSDQGVLSVFSTQDGSLLKRVRVGGNFSSSPLWAGNRIYCCSREGVITVVSSDDWRIENVNDMQSPILASPAVAGEMLFVRTEDYLACYTK